jgi:hypothetical protein
MGLVYAALVGIEAISSSWSSSPSSSSSSFSLPLSLSRHRSQLTPGLQISRLGVSIPPIVPFTAGRGRGGGRRAPRAVSVAVEAEAEAEGVVADGLVADMERVGVMSRVEDRWVDEDIVDEEKRKRRKRSKRDRLQVTVVIVDWL